MVISLLFQSDFFFSSFTVESVLIFRNTPFQQTVIIDLEDTQTAAAACSGDIFTLWDYSRTQHIKRWIRSTLPVDMCSNNRVFVNCQMRHICQICQICWNFNWCPVLTIYSKFTNRENITILNVCYLHKVFYLVKVYQLLKV